MWMSWIHVIVIIHTRIVRGVAYVRLVLMLCMLCMIIINTLICWRYAPWFSCSHVTNPINISLFTCHEYLWWSYAPFSSYDSFEIRPFVIVLPFHVMTPSRFLCAPWPIPMCTLSWLLRDKAFCYSPFWVLPFSFNMSTLICHEHMSWTVMTPSR